jgi:hypothetical protein
LRHDPDALFRAEADHRRDFLGVRRPNDHGGSSSAEPSRPVDPIALGDLRIVEDVRRSDD